MPARDSTDGSPRHPCGNPDPGLVGQLVDRLREEPWLMRALRAVADSQLSDAWIGAGVIRDIIWGQRNGGFDPATVKDVDVAFYDPTDLTRERDHRAQQRLDDLADLRLDDLAAPGLDLYGE